MKYVIVGSLKAVADVRYGPFTRVSPPVRATLDLPARLVPRGRAPHDELKAA
jgi:hypothetical protein